MQRPPALWRNIRVDASALTPRKERPDFRLLLPPDGCHEVGTCVPRSLASGHAQAGADGALARSEQRAHDQNEQVPPDRPGDMRAKRLQPQAENSGDGIAARGGSDRMVLHPMLRIPRRTPHNTISLRRIDSPICRRRVATARGGRPTARQEIDAIAAHASTAPFCAKPS